MAVERCSDCGVEIGDLHRPTCSRVNLVARSADVDGPAGGRVRRPSPDASPFMRRAYAMAGKVIGVAEFAGIRETYQRLLHLHTALGPTDTFTGMDDFERRNGTCRSCRGMLWPCDFFRLTAANLELLELLDGSRFADDWPGPVKDRRW